LSFGIGILKTVKVQKSGQTGMMALLQNACQIGVAEYWQFMLISIESGVVFLLSYFDRTGFFLL